MQPDLDQVLEEDAPCSMHEALRLACRSRGEQHVGRMIKGHAGELQRSITDQQALQPNHGAARWHGRGQFRTGNASGGDQRREVRHCPDDLDEIVRSMERLAIPSVALCDHEDARLELTKSIDDCGGAKLR